MVRPSLLSWSLAFLAALGARTASADPITLTGVVERDFDQANPSVRISPISTDPGHIGVAPWITERGWVSGFSIKDVRSSYDEASDTLFVGVNTFGIAGDADGNGDPGGADPLTTASGGIDLPNMGADKSIAIAIAPNGPPGSGTFGTPVVVAGIPANKATAGPGLNGFSVARYLNVNAGLSRNFGESLPNHQGILAFNPSAEHPDFEFTIRNFSQIPGIDPSQGFWMAAYAGSVKDVVVGEDALQWTRIPRFSPQGVPEPTTILAWSFTAFGAAWSYRRRRGGSRV
jgi:hypothetical protein